LKVSAPGAYTVKVKANDGKKDSEETESSAVSAVFGHLTVEHIEKKDATCTENGNTEYWHCKDCGKYFSDKACTTEISLESTVISKTGHVETEIQGAKDATCTEEGYTGDKVCKVCGEVLEKGKPIAKIAHTYKDGKCTVCGAADPDYKPNEGSPDSPQTGDTSNIAWWFALMVAAAIGLAGTVVYGRKKHMQK
jgi:LPXTG-motif cell wall-anchored protein